MQKGYIYQANGAWHVRYRVDGEQISRKLADYNDQYRTKRSVRPLAGEIIDPLNQGREVDGPMTLQPYTETVYFPNIKPKKSPSTLQGLFQPATPSRFSRVSVDSDFRRVRLPTSNASCTASTNERDFPPIIFEHQLGAVGDLHARSKKRDARRPEPDRRRRDSGRQENREDAQVPSTRWEKSRKLRTRWTARQGVRSWSPRGRVFRSQNFAA